MERLPEVFSMFIQNLTATHVALLSVFVTLIIFILGKRKENKLKVYETKKEEYKKLLKLFESVLSKAHSAEELEGTIDTKTFFEAGLSLAIYGSKKLYKTYCFFREISVNENIQTTKYYSQDMLIFLVGKMYSIMRREIGLNKRWQMVSVPHMLLFFLNDITKPEYKRKYYKYIYNKYRLHFIIFLANIDDLLPIVWFRDCIIKPFFISISYIIFIVIKIFIVKPFLFIKNKVTNKDVPN